MAKSKDSQPKMKYEWSWLSIHYKERMRHCPSLISLLLVCLNSQSIAHSHTTGFSTALIDKQLAGVDRSTIAAQLVEVGFDEDRQKLPVGSLSGGWKMKVRIFLPYSDCLLVFDAYVSSNWPEQCYTRRIYCY